MHTNGILDDRPWRSLKRPPTHTLDSLADAIPPTPDEQAERDMTAAQDRLIAGMRYQTEHSRES
jgi:hypothetical protein